MLSRWGVAVLRMLGLRQGRAGICQGVSLFCSCRHKEGEAVTDINLLLGICHLQGLGRTEMSLRNVHVCSLMRNCVMNEWGEQKAFKMKTF